jgi:hypothetical protein
VLLFGLHGVIESKANENKCMASMSVGAAVNAVTDLGYDARLNAYKLVRADFSVLHLLTCFATYPLLLGKHL